MRGAASDEPALQSDEHDQQDRERGGQDQCRGEDPDGREVDEHGLRAVAPTLLLPVCELDVRGGAQSEDGELEPVGTVGQRRVGERHREAGDRQHFHGQKEHDETPRSGPQRPVAGQQCPTAIACSRTVTDGLPRLRRPVHSLPARAGRNDFWRRPILWNERHSPILSRVSVRRTAGLGEARCRGPVRLGPLRGKASSVIGIIALHRKFV